MMLPLTIVLAKLAEAINNPPLTVQHPHVYMSTSTLFRAIILLFHLITFGFLISVVILANSVLFYAMLISLIPLHIFLLGLDLFGVATER